MAESTRLSSSSKDKDVEATRKKVESDLKEHEEVQRKAAEETVKPQGAEVQAQSADKATKDQRAKDLEAMRETQTKQEPVFFDPLNPEELADPRNLPAETDDVDERERVRTTSS